MEWPIGVGDQSIQRSSWLLETSRICFKYYFNEVRLDAVLFILIAG